MDYSLSKPYLRLFEAFGKAPFDVSSAAKALNTSFGAAKVVLSRLSGKKSVFSPARGKYVLIKPDSFVRLGFLAKKNARLAKLAFAVFEEFPSLELLLLYGSQVAGSADKFSDFDVLVVLPSVPSVEQQGSFKRQVEKRLKLRLHVTFLSRGSYQTFLLTEPFAGFWFFEGMVFDESDMFKPLPPTAKMGFQEGLRTAQVYFEAFRNESDGLKKRGFLVKNLRMLFMLENALIHNYDFSSVRTRLRKAVGEKLMNVLRGKALLKGGALPFDALEKLSRKTFLQVRGAIKRLGENSSDFIWKSLA
ncbi:MAG: nucleotidyltransferase domain-containing protein [Candidatus Micrarchaeia archaeon]